jgi:nicotinamide-nucleotide amidase
MKVVVITIGDELLIGQVVDTNSAWIARQITLNGGQLIQKRSVGDQLEEIVGALKEATAMADVVLVTGGLGPTKDDITKKAIAEFYGEGFVFSQETFNRIVRFMERLGRTATDGHREQCFMPQNARLLYNKMGTAPGMWMEEGDTVVVSMPGVPYEMKYLMEYEVIPLLKSRFPGEPILHRTILTVGKANPELPNELLILKIICLKKWACPTCQIWVEFACVSLRKENQR